MRTAVHILHLTLWMHLELPLSLISASPLVRDHTLSLIKGLYRAVTAPLPHDWVSLVKCVSSGFPGLFRFLVLPCALVPFVFTVSSVWSAMVAEFFRSDSPHT